MKRKRKSNNPPVANDNEINLRLPTWAEAYFKPYRYIVTYGGRGSGKSHTAAGCAVLRAYNQTNHILCARQFMNSMEDSVYSEITSRIEEYGLLSEFNIKKTTIECKRNGSTFIFKGLDKNIFSFKSMTKKDILWIEEANIVTRNAWEILKPTIRKSGSQIWLTFNPTFADDIVYKAFVTNDKPPTNAYIRKLHWTDNPYISEELDQERLDLLRLDAGMYAHVYDGELLTNSDAQILNNKWEVREFEEDEREIKYLGLDFGYSQDPVAAIRCYIKDNYLYITHEAGRKKLEINEIGDYCAARIPDFDTFRIMADCSQPGMISLMCRQGFRVVGAEKGVGSIEDGIAFLRSFEKIVIHPRCTEFIKECTLYSYKIDKKTDEITTQIVDRNNHYIDALRYSLRKVMDKRRADYKSLTRM